MPTPETQTTAAERELVFIDLSSIAHPIWHMSQSEPDPNATSTKIVARVHALSAGHPHVAICCDSGRSFRHDISAAYKANRPPSEAPLQHQITLARERLVADGFPVWAVKGFEADDLIAAAVSQTLKTEDLTALIVSADKDLLQLVGPRVRAINARDGSVLDEAAVFAKFGVRPEQMRDYLSLVGDTSDNVKGARGIGPAKAAALLARFGSIDALYRETVEIGPAAMGLKPAEAASLKEFQLTLDTTRALITLRTDVDLPFGEIARERVAQASEGFGMEDEMELPEPTAEAHGQAGPVAVDAANGEVTDLPGNSAPSSDAPSVSRLNSDALAIREPDVLAAAPAEWERQLDPRSLRDARVLAKDMYDSRLFGAYGTPQAVLSTVMLGRELGLPMMAALRSVHIIEGRHALSASLMVALILKSGMAEYFEPVGFSEKEATYETLRKGARHPVRLTHTIEMGLEAWPKAKLDWEDRFKASGWGRNPTDMLVARASSRLARMVYPDLLAGLYTPEDLAEIREQVAA